MKRNSGWQKGMVVVQLDSVAVAAGSWCCGEQVHPHKNGTERCIACAGQQPGARYCSTVLSSSCKAKQCLWEVKTESMAAGLLLGSLHFWI